MEERSDLSHNVGAVVQNATCVCVCVCVCMRVCVHVCMHARVCFSCELLT